MIENIHSIPVKDPIRVKPSLFRDEKDFSSTLFSFQRVVGRVDSRGSTGYKLRRGSNTSEIRRKPSHLLLADQVAFADELKRLVFLRRNHLMNNGEAYSVQMIRQ